MSDWTPIVGLEIHAELMTQKQDVQRLPGGGQRDRAAQHRRRSGVDGAAGDAAGHQRGGGRNGDDGRAGAPLRNPARSTSSRARATSTPTCPKATRSASTTARSASTATSTSNLRDGTTERIRVRRAHLEEDTGKSIHVGSASLIDLNRAGVPLLEIVTEPDIHSAEAAEAFARKLRAILQYLGVNNGDMSKGVMRVEPNISVKHKDDTGYRTRTEVKNLNSIRSLYRSIEYEVDAADQGVGEPRRRASGDDGLGRSQAAHGRAALQRERRRVPLLPRTRPADPRNQPRVGRAGARRLPELPDAKRDRFISLGLSAYDASVLVADKAVASYYEDVLAAGANAKSAANWIIGNLFSLSNRDGVERESVGERVSAREHGASWSRWSMTARSTRRPASKCWPRCGRRATTPPASSRRRDWRKSRTRRRSKRRSRKTLAANDGDGAGISRRQGQAVRPADGQGDGGTEGQGQPGGRQRRAGEAAGGETGVSTRIDVEAFN